jgi:hypothetical protein
MEYSTLTIHGVIWKIARHRNGVSFHHNNISVMEDDNGMAHLKNGLGSTMTHETRAACLRIGTDMILNDYASHFKPCWEE